MNFRERWLATLRGEALDRLPFVELGPAPYLMVRLFSDWDEHLAEGEDPRTTFGFDNAAAGKGHRAVPLDPFAMPRFPERAVTATDGYERRFIPQWGCVAKHVTADAENPFPSRIIEGHSVADADDWRRIRDTHFALTTDGRFPDDWADWCATNRDADVPIALQIPEPEDGVWNLLGDALLTAFHERPELVADMADHLAQLYLLCIDKALREAPVDMVVVSGSDLWPFAGPTTMRRFFFPFYEQVIARARAAGVDLICLHTRVAMAPEWIDDFVRAGVNGVRLVEMTGESHMVRETIVRHGDALFYIGNMDARVLRVSPEAIDAEVDRGAREARSLRAVPCLAGDHILPDVPFANYRRYAERLREALLGTA